MKKRTLINSIRLLYFTKLVPAVIFLIFTGYLIYHYPFKEIIIPKQLSSINSIFDEYQNGQEFLEVTIPLLYYTGYDYTINSIRKGSYYYSFIGDKCVFFLIHNQADATALTALENKTMKAKLIYDTDQMDYLISHFASDLAWTDTQLSKISADFIVSEPDYFVPKTYILMLLIGVIDLYTVISVFCYLIFIMAPQNSLVCRQFGRGRDAKLGLKTADLELKNNREYTIADISMTSNYMITKTKNQIAIIPLTDIIWGYKHSKLSRISGISYHIVIHTTHGIIRFKHKQKFEADSILDYLGTHYPNILLGYTKKNAALARRLKNKSNAMPILESGK